VREVEDMIGHAETTSNDELERIGGILYGDSFLGVYGAEQAPGHLPPSSCMVLNTDTSDKPGVHWVGLISDDAGNTYFYDSYRRSYKTLSKHWRNKRWLQVINNEPEQSMVSNICGHLTLAMFYMVFHYGPGILDYL